MDAELRTTVELHAQYLIARDTARFASLMTPSAFVGLHRRPDGVSFRPHRFAVLDLAEDGDHGASAVRFERGGSYVMHITWERREAGWTAVGAAIDPQSVRRPWWKRLRRANPGRARLELARKDLS